MYEAHDLVVPSTTVSLHPAHTLLAPKQTLCIFIVFFLQRAPTSGLILCFKAQHSFTLCADFGLQLVFQGSASRRLFILSMDELGSNPSGSFLFLSPVAAVYRDLLCDGMTPTLCSSELRAGLALEGRATSTPWSWRKLRDSDHKAVIVVCQQCPFCTLRDTCALTSNASRRDSSHTCSSHCEMGERAAPRSVLENGVRCHKDAGFGGNAYCTNALHGLVFQRGSRTTGRSSCSPCAN